RRLASFICAFFIGLSSSVLADGDKVINAAFPGAGGSYGGFAKVSDTDNFNVGVLVVQLLDTGTFTSTLTFQGVRYPLLVGKFDGTGHFAKTINVPTTVPNVPPGLAL